ncbi:MAG: hypothetical protein V4550_16590 [Gemmatimonadota bacterium]
MRHTVVFAMLLAPALQMQAQDAAHTSEPGPKMSAAFGVHYGSPLRTSVALGFMADFDGKRNDGFIATLEPGHQGTEISAGYFRMIGSFGSGYSVRGAVVRTNDEPWKASAHTTYVGVEAHWMLVFGIGGRIGYLRRASRSVLDPHDTIVSAGISIGA